MGPRGQGRWGGQSVRLGEAHKRKTAVDKVRLRVVVDCSGHEAAQRLDGHGELERFAVTQDVDLDGFVGELEVDDVLEGEALLCADGEAAVVGNLLPIKCQDDIVALDQLGSGGEGGEAADEHAGVEGIVHAVVAATRQRGR